MFQLTEHEKQEVVANCDHLKKLKYSPNLPNVFTEHGAVMLASVLNSDRAIAVNIQIVRVFIKMRQLLEANSKIFKTLEQLQKKDLQQDQQILLIFKFLKQLEQVKKRKESIDQRRRIGFKK